MKQVTGKVTFNINQLKLKTVKQIAKAQKALDEQVVKDMSQFTPYKSGTLESTAHNDLGKGIIKNTTRYARRQYYGVDFNYTRDHNPKATHHWFEKAKSIYVKMWQKLVNTELNE